MTDTATEVPAQKLDEAQLGPKISKKRQKKMSRKDYITVHEGQCPFIITHKIKPCRKARYKRQDGSKSKYCVVHAYEDTPDLKYVACPYEPKNTFPWH